jgi:hypothetical protein
LQGESQGFSGPGDRRRIQGKGYIGKPAPLVGTQGGNLLQVFPGKIADLDEIVVKNLGVIKGERRLESIGVENKDGKEEQQEDPGAVFCYGVTMFHGLCFTPCCDR